MRILIDVHMDYAVFTDESVLLTLEAAQTPGQTVVDATLDIADATIHRIGGEALLGQRVWASVTGQRLRLRYKATVDVTRSAVSLDGLSATPMPALPAAVLTYLRPSRFCQSDLFTTLAQQRFGHLEGGAKVAAIADWVAAELSYVSGSSNGTTTAVDTFVARAGVCRDYAHLVCGLARAASIPARYVSVYCPEVAPQDFHAVAEVWLDGAWYLVDATGMSKAETTAVIACGRDASDVAFMETEQWADWISQTVSVTRI
jgi:transglutaminase-like putative cysteine protease